MISIYYILYVILSWLNLKIGLKQIGSHLMHPKQNTSYLEKKSQTIDFTNLHLRIENQHIDRIGIGCKEESFKFVGIHLDEHLSWNFHVKMSQIK